MNRILAFFSLTIGEEDKSKVLDNVTSNISFRGSNLWILACAIAVASVGLNVNSTAVIIGAMLISPLMGPIIGAGFGLGMFDFELLRKSLKNLLIATIVSLIISSLYFYLSPFKEVNSELLARTSPNIYDILIAFFGGLAGVIAITRVEKGNPIPGVAIATALMPPLCTAGFGLAVGNFKFFFGALYLYTINCVFICIATFLIVKYLHYPRVRTLNLAHQKRVNFIMSLLIFILLLPSIYFAYVLFQENKFDEKVNTYLENEFTSKGYTILYKKTVFNANPKKIELAFLSKKFSKKEVQQLTNKLQEYKLLNAKLYIRQDTTDLKKDILNEISKEKILLSRKEEQISNLKKQIALNLFDNKGLLAEIKVLFPEVTDITIAKHSFTNSDTNTIVIVYKSTRKIANTDQMKLWLEKRLKSPQVLIYWTGE